MNKIKIITTLTHEFKPEDINDLIVGALEGGINYWCKKAVIKLNAVTGDFFGVAKEDQDKVIYASDVIGYGGTLILFDAESTDKWELSLENVLKAIEKHCTDRHIAPSDLMDDYDADDCDIIIQYALFNEQVFC
jgi:hypothetical protein